jgi:multidrug efflux pump subunit AcrA (membrane-fusion protein)
MLLLLYSCQEAEKIEQESRAKVQVSVSKISQGYLPDYIDLKGKTIYLNKTTLTAPISGYITKVKVKQGDKVQKGQLLFEMQTQEAYAMQQNDSTNSYGIVRIYAPENARLVSLNIVNSSVFADKGSVMCILMASNDLKLQVNVPFEYNKYAKIGNQCKVILPDNTEISGVFSKILPQIDEISQTVEVLANIKSNRFIPENMIVSVLLDKGENKQSQILPKNCLQSDALMQNFWVMKLINDSTAVQTKVKVGQQTHRFRLTYPLTPLVDRQKRRQRHIRLQPHRDHGWKLIHGVIQGQP